MFKALTPIFAIIIAVGLAVTYVSPTFGEIKALEDEAVDYADAIEKAQQLQSLIAQKIDKMNGFNPNDIEDLKTMVPDSVDEVSLVMDLDALARANHMTFSNIVIKEGVESGAGEAEVLDPAILDPEDPEYVEDQVVSSATYTPTEVSFSVTGTYEDMRSFLSNLEESLVLVDVTELNFSTAEEEDLTSYAMTVRAYAFTMKD